MYEIADLSGADADALVETQVWCRFLDCLIRRSDRWAILKRTVVFDAMDFRLLQVRTLGASFAAGSRDSSDPLWRFR